MAKPFDSLRKGDLRSHNEETESEEPIYLKYLEKNFQLQLHNCGGDRCVNRGVIWARMPILPSGPPVNEVTDFIFSVTYGAGRNKRTDEALSWSDSRTKPHWTKKDCIDFRFEEAKTIVEPTAGLTLTCDWPEGLRADVYEGLKKICGTTKVATMVFHALNPDAVPIIDRAQIWNQFKNEFGWGSADGITGAQFDDFCNQAGESFYEAISLPRGVDLKLPDQSSKKGWRVEDIVTAIRLPLRPAWAGKKFNRRHTLGKFIDNVLRFERPVLAR